MSDYDDLPSHCGKRVDRIICAPAIHTDITPYISPGTGREVASRTQQREDLLRSNAILDEPGLKKDVARWGQEKKEKAFAPIAEAVDSAVKQLVNAGKIEN